MTDRFASREMAARPGGDVTAWRRARLLRAGFGRQAAAELSRELAVDFHALLELVDRGCPPALAARIVAPLETANTSGRP